MRQVVIVGCGIVGAMIAYELSQSALQVIVLDRQPLAQAATGAALGVLMGIISQKVRGKAWEMRQASIRRYATLIPELEAVTALSIPYNRQGIVRLCLGEAAAGWLGLQEVRRAQGWDLEIWQRDRLHICCPQILNSRITGAIYSPQDAQIDPTMLTLALVTAAQRHGVTFRFDAEVHEIEVAADGSATAMQIQTADGLLEIAQPDWLILAAGLGSTALSKLSPQPIDIRPVLGQAMRVKLDQPLGNPSFQPVITGEDIHIVPLGDGEYWVGATVEFPTESGSVEADGHRLLQVWQGAIDLCPALAEAEVLQTWSGLRPRPHNRPAPIVEPLAGCANILLATGHYRNGILLAPATAQWIRDRILTG